MFLVQGEVYEGVLGGHSGYMLAGGFYSYVGLLVPLAEEKVGRKVFAKCFS